MATIADLRTAADFIKQHVDLVEVIGEVTPLTKAGSDLYKANCCFHEEKSPSLTVTPSKGLYHCFGCKASGDIITFYKDHYNMTTQEAIYEIAHRFQLDITQFERELTPEEAHKAKLAGINKQAAEGLNAILMQRTNRGYSYLVDRGITDEVIEDFQLGYSPNIRDLLGVVDGRDDSDLGELLLDTDHGQMWDDAIVYPLHDMFGRVIGFKNRPYWGGQTVDHKGRKLAKFLGTSSQSPLHEDGHVYGLHIARKHLDKGRLILVEGQHDVLSMHAQGIKNTTGSDGTALNEEKLKYLASIGVREIVVLYDGDDAGRNASIKIATEGVSLDSEISIKIATLPDGEDPDEYIRKAGKLAILKVLYEAVYASQYLIDKLEMETGLNTVTQRLDFMKKVQPLIAKAQIQEQPFLISYVAEKTKVSESVIEDMIRMEQSRGKKSILYSVEGEKIVLGGALRDDDFRDDLLLNMKKDDWYLPKHGMLFDMLVEMSENSVPISIDTIKATMNNRGYNQVFNDGSYIDEVMATIGDYKTIVNDLIDKSMRRKLEKQAQDLQRKVQNLGSKVVLTVEEHYGQVQKITDSNNTAAVSTPKSASKTYMDNLIKRMREPDKILGIELGAQWKSTTRLLNGFQKTKLYTIAANQSVGKTTILANWLNDIAVTQKRKWAHFTLEMMNEEMTAKIINIRAGVNGQEVERGNVTDFEFKKIQQATIEYHEGGLILIDDINTMEGIMNMTRKLIRTEGIEGVSIDYIQLMRMERNHNLAKYQEEGEISGALKNDVAKGLNIPVVILSQMSRRALDRDVQKAEDGQGAYKIAQDSDVYMILQEKKETEIEEFGIERGNMTLNLDKNRGGKADVLLDVMFLREVQQMGEIG